MCVSVSVNRGLGAALRQQTKSKRMLKTKALNPLSLLPALPSPLLLPSSLASFSLLLKALFFSGGAAVLLAKTYISCVLTNQVFSRLSILGFSSLVDGALLVLFAECCASKGYPSGSTKRLVFDHLVCKRALFRTDCSCIFHTHLFVSAQ